MNNKLLITVYVPILEKKFDLFVPAYKQTNEAVLLIEKALKELSAGSYYKENLRIYRKDNFEELDYSNSLKKNNIVNGTELIII